MLRFLAPFVLLTASCSKPSPSSDLVGALLKQERVGVSSKKIVAHVTLMNRKQYYDTFHEHLPESTSQVCQLNVEGLSPGVNYALYECRMEGSPKLLGTLQQHKNGSPKFKATSGMRWVSLEECHFPIGSFLPNAWLKYLAVSPDGGHGFSATVTPNPNKKGLTAELTALLYPFSAAPTPTYLGPCPNGFRLKCKPGSRDDLCHLTAYNLPEGHEFVLCGRSSDGFWHPLSTFNSHGALQIEPSRAFRIPLLPHFPGQWSEFALVSTGGKFATRTRMTPHPIQGQFQDGARAWIESSLGERDYVAYFEGFAPNERLDLWANYDTASLHTKIKLDENGVGRAVQKTDHLDVTGSHVTLKVKRKKEALALSYSWGTATKEIPWKGVDIAAFAPILERLTQQASIGESAPILKASRSGDTSFTLTGQANKPESWYYIFRQIGDGQPTFLEECTTSRDGSFVLLSDEGAPRPLSDQPFDVSKANSGDSVIFMVVEQDGSCGASLRVLAKETLGSPREIVDHLTTKEVRGWAPVKFGKELDVTFHPHTNHEGERSYTIETKGFPPNKTFTLSQRIAKQNWTPLGIVVSDTEGELSFVGAEGQPTPLASIPIQVLPCKRGEWIQFSILAEDQSCAIREDLIPHPIQDRADGCCFAAKLISPKEGYYVYADGFAPNEPLEVRSTSEGNELVWEASADSEGFFQSVFKPDHESEVCLIRQGGKKPLTLVLQPSQNLIPLSWKT